MPDPTDKNDDLTDDKDQFDDDFVDDADVPTEDDDQDQDTDDDDTSEDDDFDPKELEGKDPSELIKVIEDQRKELSRKGNEITGITSRLEALEKAPEPQDDQVPGDDFDFEPPAAAPGYDFTAPPPAPPAPGSPVATDPNKAWDYEKPVDSTRGVVRDELAMLEQARTIREVQRNKAKAKMAFENGAQAMGTSKNLFAGIEGEVRKAVYDYYFPYVMNGAEVDHLLRDSKTWVTVAQNIRIKNGEWDRVKPTRTPRPTSHQPGDRPGASRGKRGKREVAMKWDDQEVQKMMTQYKLSKAEAEDIIRAEQGMIEGGERR